jgi:hypothetical protein
MAVLARWRSATNLLIENVAVIDTLETLVERHAVRGKQVHDCNLIAVMLVHKVDRLLTRNPRDFKRFREISVQPVMD